MGTPKLKAFEDASHDGNSAKYHTGKPCIEKGCPEPAGTWWSPHWCFKHNVERINRIDAGLNDVILSSRLRRMVDDETSTLRAFCERLQKERDAAALIVWRKITPADRVHGKEVLLSRGQPYVTRIGRWYDTRTVDRGQGHVRPYKYPAGWYVDGGFSQMKDGMEPLWIADIPPAPSAPADRPTSGDTHGN